MKKLILIFLSCYVFSFSNISYKPNLSEIKKKLELNTKEQGDTDIKEDSNFEKVENSSVVFAKNNITGSISEKEKIARTKLYLEVQKHLGKPYVWGANSYSSFDCSSLMQIVFRDALKLNIARVSRNQSETVGKKISLNNVRMGDLLFFETTGKGVISHVGMYVGNGEMIHASSKSGKVIRVKLKGYYLDTFKFARSIFLV